MEVFKSLKLYERYVSFLKKIQYNMRHRLISGPNTVAIAAPLIPIPNV